MDLNVKDENGHEDKSESRKSPNKKEIDVKKKQMTLNLDSSKSASRKRAVIGNSSLNNATSITSILDPQAMSGFWNSPISKVILESPDVQMLKLHTPDVEKFLLASNLNSTPTPSLANRKFLETMQQLKELNSEPFNQQNNNSNSDSSRPPSNASNSDNAFLQDDNSNATSMISGNNSNCSFNTSNNSANNQSFNENADLEAIGMLKNQDLSKLERKRLRNRIAASKCRKRKLERISNLEDRVKKLKDENQTLYDEVMKLRDKNNRLKSEVCSHKQKGCNIDLSNISIRD